MNRINAMLCALAALAAACGGGGVDALPYLGEVSGVVCPADPSTFVGPLQPECDQA